MVSIEKDCCEQVGEEDFLFSGDCSPYYVGSAVSWLILNEAEYDSLMEEITGIVRMVSILGLRLTYIMPLESVPMCSSIKCKVSRFGCGYKVRLIEDNPVRYH